MIDFNIDLTKKFDDLFPSIDHLNSRFINHPFFDKVINESVLDVGICKPSIQKILHKEEKQYSKNWGWVEIRNNEQNLKSPRTEAAAHYCVVTNKYIHIVNGLLNLGISIPIKNIKYKESEKKFFGKTIEISGNVSFSNYSSIPKDHLLSFSLHGSKPFISNLLIYISTLQDVEKGKDNNEICEISIHPPTSFNQSDQICFIYYVDKLQGKVIFSQPSVMAHRYSQVIGFMMWFSQRARPFHQNLLKGNDLLSNFSIKKLDNSEILNLIDTVYWYEIQNGTTKRLLVKETKEIGYA